MKVSLKPLTPVWTGNASGVSDQLRTTGLLGSLRWWFEGIIRGLGYYACDPTSDEASARCEYDSKKSGPQICPACWLFGTTGWARRFRLSASGLEAEPWYVLANPAVARMHEGWLTRIYQSNSKVLWGERLEMNFAEYLRVREGFDVVDRQVSALLSVLTKHGAIGAKPQNGYGAVELLDVLPAHKGAISAFLKSPPEKIRARRSEPKGWFSLARTAFFRFQVRDTGVYERGAVRIPSGVHARFERDVLPIAYDIRYKSRAKNFRTGAGTDLGIRPLLKAFLLERRVNPADILGSPAKEPERIASRVFVTHLYRTPRGGGYEFRVWMHLPEPKQVEGVTSRLQEIVTREIFPGATCVMTLGASLVKEL